MPGENLWDWSTTALNNGTADSLINWAEGQTRASVNNSARGMMAALAKWRNLNNGSITTGGTANAQTFTSGVGFTVVPTGLRVTLTIGVGLTNAAGGTTLNMDGIGAVTIKYGDGTDIYAGALRAGFGADLVYNGTNWILLPNVPSVTVPTQQIFTSGSGTYSTPAAVKWIKVRLIGGGGGGGGNAAGTVGTATTFGALTGSGGAGGGNYGLAGGAGGAASGGDVNLVGGPGTVGSASGGDHAGGGGSGGNGPFGGAGSGQTGYNYGVSASANTGAGGGSSGLLFTGSALSPTAGGGAGGYVEKLIVSPAATYAYAVGPGGAGGAIGGGQLGGGNGGSGIIIVEEHYI